jgi:glyoxylase-like metal-dependent hydrolase (beta-lactamase superfamily II)
MRADHRGGSRWGTRARVSSTFLIHDYGDGLVAIDSKMHGWPGVTAVYYLAGPHPAIIETAPATSLPHVLDGLAEAGADRLDWIVVTHIHLDHAGAAGHLAERFPGARVVVREEGAPHLVDPSRLWASAARLYPDMERRWGSVVPVPESRIEPVAEDGTVAELGPGRTLEAIYTPGHARHHMAVLDGRNGDLFVGDALGVCLPEARRIRPATPPPEFDLEQSVASIRRLAALGAQRVFPTHFGQVPDPVGVFDEAVERLGLWVRVAEEVAARGGGVDEVAGEFRLRVLERSLGEELVRKLEDAVSYRLNAMGILRYLGRRAATP